MTRASNGMIIYAILWVLQCELWRHTTSRETCVILVQLLWLCTSCESSALVLVGNNSQSTEFQLPAVVRLIYSKRARLAEKTHLR
jgi:hypothetical protein